MSNVKAPQFLTDLYRDLRDRRLLLPAILLAAALVAVPLLLSEKADTTPPPPPAAASGEALPTEPAVFAGEQLGVRDFRERLSKFKSKNPFEQQFDLPELGAGDEVEVTETVTEDLGVSSGGGSFDGGEVSVDGGSTSTASAPPPSSSGGSGSSSEPSEPPKEPDPKLLTRRVNVAIGPEGEEPKVMKDVKLLDFVPGEAHPVLVFLGANEDGTLAAFAVSSDVASVAGDGTCLAGLGSCSYLFLEEGEEAELEYTVETTTYHLKLLRIRTVELKTARPKAKPAGDGSARTSLPR